MLRHVKLTAVAWLLAFLLSASGTAAAARGAQEADTQPRKTDGQVLESMVVTAGRTAEKKEDITTNISVYTREDLKRLDVQDLSDLMLKEGFMVREYPNSTISAGVRGFRTETHGNDLSSHVLILIDGRRAGTGNLAKITMDNVDRVELIRGPGSVQYGASAMGGVINVITRKGRTGFEGSVEAILGNWDYKKGAAELSGGNGRFDYAVSASKSSQDDYDTAAGTPYYNTGYDSKENVDFNGGFTFLPKNRIGVSFSSYEGDHIGSPDYLSDNDKLSYVDHALESFDIYYDGGTQDGFWSWNLRYFKGKDEYETFDPAQGTSRTYFRDTDNQGIQAQVTAKWDIAHITAGIDWTDYAIANTHTVAGRENTYENPAVFVLAKRKFFDDRLVLSAGGRYDEYEVESDEDRSKDATNWASSFGAVVKVLSGLSVRANYAEAFRMPTADELFMLTDYSSWGMGVWSGNENLDPESSKTYELGVDYTRGTFSCSLTWFYTEFKNKIGYAYNPDTDITQYENIEGATLSGFEGSFQVDVGEYFGWDLEVIPYASFSLMDQYDNEETGKHLEYTPDWSASYGLRLNHPASGFTSRFTITHFGAHDITDYEGTGATCLGGDDVVSLGLSKRLFSLERYGEVTLKGEVNNLFDTDYALVQGYPSPGRTFYLGMNYAF